MGGNRRAGDAAAEATLDPKLPAREAARPAQPALPAVQLAYCQPTLNSYQIYEEGSNLDPYSGVKSKTWIHNDFTQILPGCYKDSITIS